MQGTTTRIAVGSVWYDAAAKLYYRVVRGGPTTVACQYRVGSRGRYTREEKSLDRTWFTGGRLKQQVMADA